MSHRGHIGVVVIGRNEGERLVRCLKSVTGGADHVVYVDSGSTDDSVAQAKALAADVVELDMTRPFSAARARNEGWRHLLEQSPDLQFIQFVDGDCEVAPDWMERAGSTLQEEPRCAVVCGRRRERQPEASIYNRLCDLEWDTPVGEASACGGDSMMRVDALQQVGGFDDSLIAGEEPELCFRLRGAGWSIQRIHAEMVLHDAAMTRFGQWWKRNRRSGHAYAEGAAMHGRESDERYAVRECRSNWLWGMVLPAAALLFAWPTFGISIGVLLTLYAAQAARVYWRHRRGTPQSDHALLWAVACVAGKPAQALGQVDYWRNRVLGRTSRLIEYK